MKKSIFKIMYRFLVRKCKNKYRYKMKKESKFWQLVKKKTPQIQWTRLESWASFGVPDLLGYNDNCGFFLVELKVVEGNKVRFSPHQKLFLHLTRKKRNFILLTSLPLSWLNYTSLARSPVCS